MLSGWLVHELRQLANRISNVRASNRQVLKTSRHSAIFEGLERIETTLSLKVGEVASGLATGLALVILVLVNRSQMY